MVTARRAAVKALGAWRRSGAWSGIYLDNLINSEKLDKREAALAQRLTLGVMQNRALCDFYIAGFSTQRLNRIEPAVLDILRVGVYQIAFLDRVPDFSAVSESVELAKKLSNPRAQGFVNAVLRKMSAEKARLPQPPDLSTKYSCPEWLTHRFEALVGAEETEKLLAINNTPAPLTIQANTLKCAPKELFERLGAKRSRVFPGAAQLECTGAVERMREFTHGEFFVQDLSARASVEASGVKPGDSVLDLCAAPGGKSFMAAILMEDRGSVRAMDLYEKKLPLISGGAKRLGIGIISAAAGDASKKNDGLAGSADVVFADVPCSGLGIIRKKPEIRYKRPEDIAGLPALQLEILKNAAACVRPGGVLMYSTCTLLPEENEDVVGAFLSENDAFAAESFSLPEPYGEAAGGMLTIWPQRQGSDGFFIAKLRKKA